MFLMKEVEVSGTSTRKTSSVLLCIASGHLLDLATMQVTQLHSGPVRINGWSLAWPENHGDISVSEARQQQVCQDHSWLSPSTYLLVFNVYVQYIYLSIYRYLSTTCIRPVICPSYIRYMWCTINYTNTMTCENMMKSSWPDLISLAT